MAVGRKSKRRAQFGDFQTPIELARKVCSLLGQRGLEPVSILEPTCGRGSFIAAALESFASIRHVIGIDIDAEHVKAARSCVREKAPAGGSIRIVSEDFFAVDWDQVLRSLPDPLLVIGNPPWVTNAELGRLGSSNLPDKSNFHNRRGIDAMTGSSNFDISEWMLNKVLEWVNGREATLAMLCKTAVARKVLHNAWKRGEHLKDAAIYNIETSRYFDAAADACLLVITASLSNGSYDCQIYDNLEDALPAATFGYRRERLVANVRCFEAWKHLEGKQHYKWRSGVKHDCAQVMEFRKETSGYRNGLGELVDLEDDYLYPMLKSSDIANGFDGQQARWMLVPQRIVGQDTHQIRRVAPKTWRYLQRHARLLDRRASSVYRNCPRFSVFGVGEYSFAAWKVAISGFYKKLEFRVVGPYEGKPVVLDDTCYFIACKSRQEALFIAELLNSGAAKQFFCAFVFWDEKRPITTGLLNRLDLLALARQLGVEEALKEFLGSDPGSCRQPSLFSEGLLGLNRSIKNRERLTSGIRS